METEKLNLHKLPKTNELTLKILKKEGMEIATFSSKAYLKGNKICLYIERPIKATVFYFLNKYIVYTYIYQEPLIQEYSTYNEAIKRFEEFINKMNK